MTFGPASPPPPHQRPGEHAWHPAQHARPALGTHPYPYSAPANNGFVQPPPPSDPRIRQAVTPWHRQVVVRVLMVVVAALVIGLGFTLLLLIIGVSLGPGLLLLATVFAALPVPVLLMGFLWLDRYEPEPWHYLAFTFGWGAFVATVIALFINEAGATLYDAKDNDDGMTKVAVFVAPPTEELAKAAPLFIMLALAWFGRRTVNGVVDGIVYAGFSAVGFAFTENVLYLGGAYLKGEEMTGSGIVALLFTFVLRGVLSPFAHPLFTVLTGIGVGIAVRNKHLAIRILAPIGGLLAAIGLHALWNFIAASGSWKVMGIAYVALMLPMLAAMIGIAIWIRTHEAKATQRILPAYVRAGWFTTSELTALTTIRDRRAAREWASTYGGAPGEKAMREFQLAATRLAILREDIERGLVRKDYNETERELLDIIATRRQVVMGYVSAWQNAWRAWPYAAPAYSSYTYR